MWFFVLFLALASDQFVRSGYIYDRGLGTDCLYDEDCITRNSFCKGNKICACKIGYQYDPGSDVCFPREVDLKCTEDYDCSALENAKCIKGRCQCRSNYVPSKNQSSCLPTMKVTSVCEEDIQCNSVMNQSYCHPHSKRCVCERGLRQHAHRLLCVQKQKLHYPCVTLEDCEEEENKGKVECKPSPNHLVLTCQCAEGYVERNDICYKDGSSQAVASLYTIIALLLVRYIM